MYSPRFSHRRDAFTLIELLVVIVIIGVLTGISLPIYNSVTVRARQTTTLSNMKQVGAAFLLYANDNNSQLPNRAGQSDPKWPGLLAQYIQNLQVYLSPIPDYIGKQATLAQLLTMSPTNSNGTANPSYQSTTNYTDYFANGYNDLNAYSDSTVVPRLSNISTPTQVIILGIKKQTAGDFYMDFQEGNEIGALDTTAWPNGSIYVFCDGSSRFLKFPPPSGATQPNYTMPPTGDYYTDWLWLVNKNAAATQ